MTNGCELCEQSGGQEIYRCETYRIVLVDDASFPGFCRVIWNAHVAEATDLAAQAIAARFGSGEVDGKIQAHVIAVGR